MSEALFKGQVLRRKRIPRADSVYPVQATALALAMKGVKIEANDDGRIGMRYVPLQRIQRQGWP